MSPETIDAMIAAGVTAEVLAAAWKAEIAKQERASQERRANDAERQRRHRESRDVTVTGRDSANPSPSEVPPQTPLPNSPNQFPLSPPIVEEEKRQAIKSCIRQAFPMADDPEWLPDSFTEFRTMRRGMRNVPYSAGADRRCIAKLTRLRDEGHDPEKLISKAIENGHRTFFPDDSTKSVGGKTFTREERIATLKQSIEFFTRIRRPDDVRECRRRLAEIEGGQVSALISQVAKGMAA